MDGFREALELYRQLEDRRGAGSVLCNVGALLIRLGRYAEAVSEIDAALRLLRAVGDRDAEATTLKLFGEALHRLGRHADVRDSHQQALGLAREIGSGYLEALAWCDLGRSHGELGERERARRCLERALAMSRRVALRHHREALERGVGFGDVGRLSAARNDYAASLRAAGGHVRAGDQCQRAYELAVRTESQHEERRALDGLAAARICAALA